MSVGLYSGVSGLALGTGLYRNVSGLWGGSPGLVNGFDGGNPFGGASLYLNFLSGSLDSRVGFSRGTNATMVDSTGRIVYAPANLLPWSEQFDNGAWAKGVGVTVTANAETAPNGTNTADNITFSAGGAAQFVRGFATLTVGVAYTVSVFARLVSGTPTFTFDVGNGASASTAQTPTALWQRFFFTFTFSGANQWVDFEASAAGTIAFWGAQLEPVTYQTAPGPYVATTASAYYGPRFDYNPLTLGALGLLIEEQRTNLVTYSEQFDNATWSKSNATVTANAAVSPDGTNSADRLIPTAAAIDGRIIQAFTGSAGATYTLSVYGKADAFSNIRLYSDDSGSNSASVSYNLATGVVSTAASTNGTWASVSSTIADAGNGWYRVTLTWTATGSAPTRVAIWCRDTGNGTSGIFIWGAQLEVGAFATSYIPTVASQVTRNADVASMTGTNFSGWYNQTEGTLVVDGSVYSTGLSGNRKSLAIITQGNFTNAARTAVETGSTGVGVVTAGGVTQAAFGVSGLSANIPFKLALAMKTDDFAFSLNGSAALTDTSGSVIAAPVFFDIGYGPQNTSGAANTAGDFLNGHVRQIAYFNTRLPNAQLQTLSSPSLVPTLVLDFTASSYASGY